MKYRRLGRTDIAVSAFGLGCGNFGGIGSAPEFFGQGESEDEAFAVLDHAVDMGINFVDTADAYGGGRSEAIIGTWLRRLAPGKRARLLISSKVGNPVDDDPAHAGLSREHILRQVDASLNRLGVDHLDMYLAHEVDPATPLAETVGAFDEVIRAGKVRAVGISNHSATQVRECLAHAGAQGLHRFEWVQNSFNLIDQADQADTLELCRAEGLGFTPFGPLGGGWLTGKYRFDADYPEGSRMSLRPEPYMKHWNQETFDAIDRLTAMADGFGVSTAGLALAWLHGHPDVTAPIVGPRRPEHFEPLAQALALDLPTEDHATIGRLFGGDRAHG